MKPLATISVLGTAATILWAAYMWPKSCTFGGGSANGLVAASSVGYYRGLGLHSHPGFFGRDYFRVRLAPSVAEDGFTDVEFEGIGWNRFRGTYPDGTLREEGVCWVLLNSSVEPFPDLHNVKKGKYYDTTGTLRSEIKDGSGVQTYWSRNGVKRWELELKDGKRVRHAMWYDNGQLIGEQKYLDASVDGPYVTYHRSGAKKREGAYRRGERVGKWIEYGQDGTILETTDYGDDGKQQRNSR